MGTLLENQKGMFAERIKRISLSKNKSEYSLLTEDFLCAVADGEFDHETTKELAKQLVETKLD